MDSSLFANLNPNHLAELTTEAISGNLIHELEHVTAEEHEYEALPSNCGTRVHLLAGAAAGILEHCVMYPVDSVKVFVVCIFYRKLFCRLK